MRADIHDGPEHDPLQAEAGYIDARPYLPDRRKPLATRGRTLDRLTPRGPNSCVAYLVGRSSIHRSTSYTGRHAVDQADSRRSCRTRYSPDARRTHVPESCMYPTMLPGNRV